MRRKSFVVLGLITGFMLLGVMSALADSVTGGGQTSQSAALGFNVHSNLTGELNYNADPNGPNAGFDAHCSEFTSYVPGTTNTGFPKVSVGGSCTDQTTSPMTIKARFVDKGTPGTNDLVCIRFFDSSGNLLIHDFGNLQAGNITIHEDPDNPGGQVAEILEA